MAVDLGTIVDKVTRVTTAWLQFINDTVNGLANTSNVAQGAALIGRGAQVVDSITALRGLLKTSASTKAFVTGYYAAGDGGGGPYYYDSTDVASADNGGTIIVATDGGRWKLVHNGRVTVKQFGAKGDKVASDAAFIQAAFNAALSEVYVPDGDYLIGADLTLPTSTIVKFANDAWFYASANNRTVFKSTVDSYYSQVHNAHIDGDGFTGVTCFDMTNFRLNAGIYGGLLRDAAVGIIARTGCFGAKVVDVAMERVVAPVQCLANDSVLMIQNPSFDNTASIGGTGAGIGVDIRAGAGSDIGVIVQGGFIQGFATGVKDAGIGTKVRDVYFEVCSASDIEGDGARGSEYSGIVHFGPSGAAGYKLRNCDACTVFNPLMASGARTALYDVDSTNTNCQEFRAESNASYNTPTGALTYLGSIAKQTSGTWTPVIAGTTAAGAGTYTTQNGTWRRTGDFVHIAAEIVWTAHTGTGNITITGVPAALQPSSFVPRRVGQICLVNVTATGPHLFVQFTGTGTNLSIVEATAAGVEALIAMDAAGTIYINMAFAI